MTFLWFPLESSKSWVVAKGHNISIDSWMFIKDWNPFKSATTQHDFRQAYIHRSLVLHRACICMIRKKQNFGRGQVHLFLVFLHCRRLTLKTNVIVVSLVALAWFTVFFDSCSHMQNLVIPKYLVCAGLYFLESIWERLAELCLLQFSLRSSLLFLQNWHKRTEYLHP